MRSPEERAVEVVVLANSFRAGRDAIARDFPASVTALYDAVITRPEWASAATLTEQALVIAHVLEDSPELAAAYQADVDAGLLGFGAGDDAEVDAAIHSVQDALEPKAEMAGPDDGLLSGPVDGDTDTAWRPLPGGEPGPPPVPSPSPAPSVPPATPPPPPMPAPVVPPATPATPPPADAPPADAVQTWLNAELNDPHAALQVAQTRTLALSYGEKSEQAVAAAAATLMIPRDEATIDVTVTLASTDFTVPPFPQQLRIGRDGHSVGRALFDITPLHSGPSTLSVLVDVKGNFLQRLEITFDVGAASTPDITNYGRPAAAASVLEERTATMQFMPAVGGYQLIAPAVAAEPIDVLVTQDQLAARIQSVRDALLGVVSDPAVSLNLDIAKELGDQALSTLAFEGFRLFQAIFAGPQAGAELRSVGAWLRETLSGDVTTLQVVSSGFPVPWALMYLTERFDATPLTWDNFIGMRHVVEQIPMAEIAAVPPAPTIASTPELSVRVLLNEGIDAQMPSHPIATQREYWTGRGVALTEGTKVDDLVRSALLPAATDKVLYLFCHAVASPTDSDDSHLILSGGQSVTLAQLSVYAPIEDALPAHPLVFINACESAELSPNFYDGFVPYFLAKGARGVIGTECKTPGLFASEWAKAFFDELFAGKSLGEVVLDLRRRFLAEHNNPLGLLYGIHCDTDTRVDPALVGAVH